MKPKKFFSSGYLFDAANILFLGLLAATMIYPFLYILNISISSAAEASRGGLHLWPRNISLAAYQVVFSDTLLVRAFINSVVRTLIGTVVTVICCAIAAYPLSRRETPFRRSTTLFILFTMVFSGGLVPSYLLIRSLGLMDTMASLILPTILSAFNIVIIKNFFQSIPESYVEAARIDGASEWRILFQIFIPLSGPVLATVGLWTAVMHWNSWFDAMLYITSENKQVLQTILQRIVIDSSPAFLDAGMAAQEGAVTSQTIKAATTLVTILPILLCYPFLQRFFTKGIMLGGVKE
ncbi:MAG: carbohydrate ABC transporter permease [Verrucomicrobiota bacterium]